MILLFGSKGYLGSNFAETYSASGELICVSRANKDKYHVKSFNRDYQMPLKEVFNFAREQGVKSVVNLTASTSKSSDLTAMYELVETNVKLVAELAIHTLESNFGCFLHLSTFSKFSSVGEYKPQTLYAATKKSGEDILEFLAIGSATRFYVLDLFDVYGPKHHPNKLIPQAFKCFSTNRILELHTDGRQFLRPINVRDAIRALQHVLDNQHTLGEVGNVTYYSVPGKEERTVFDIVGMISSFFPESEFRISTSDQSGSKVRTIPRAFSPSPELPGFINEVDLVNGLKEIFEIEYSY